MNHTGIEVVVTLTPIGAPHELERVFSLSLDAKHVDVGRASRNMAKGLTAAENNAWFDSPIMSRRHAKFSLSSLMGSGIYLHDYGSTHGTFIGVRRLQPKVDYTINNGEVITFGVKITSGPRKLDNPISTTGFQNPYVIAESLTLHAVSYPPREFRVKLSWQPWSPTSLLPHSNPLRRGAVGFHFPDEDDSASDESREASLQIVDSYPRTYSVPSSDEDGESDEEEETNEASALTTPEKSSQKRQSSLDRDSESSDNEICESVDSPGQCAKSSDTTNREGKSCGTTQFNPIDLEGPSQHKKDVFEVDIDDEGPEVLPISQSFVYAAEDASIIGSSKSPKPSLYSPMISLTSTKDHDKKRDEQPALVHGVIRSDPEGQVVAKTQNSYPQLRSPKGFLQGSIGDTTDELNSVDEDDYDDDDDLLIEGHDYTEQSRPNATLERNGLPKLNAPRPHVTFDLGRSTPIVKVTPVPFVSCSSEINVSSEIIKGSLTAPQRAPSPSDAALARKADSTDSRPKWLSSRVFSDSSALPNVDNAQNLQEMHQRRYCNAWADNYPLNSPFAAEFAGQNFLDDPEVESTRYEDGPFTSRPSVDRYPLLPAHLSQQSWRPCTVTSPMQPQDYYTSISQCSNMPVVSDSKLTFSTTIPEDSNNSPEDLSNNNGNLKTLHKGNEGQPSRVNISDLVNSYADGARTLKRKADDISADSDIQEPVSTKSQARSLDDVNIQDFMLADAQPRDAPDIDVLTSQVSSVSSAPDLRLSPHETDISGVNGPARKKLRTFAPSVGGFGKFASGICVGVAGALAAFLATIPMSVREEALHEVLSGA